MSSINPKRGVPDFAVVAGIFNEALVQYNAPGITLTTLRDLLSEPARDTHWLVDGILPTGCLSVIVAKPKVGKSTLARQLALTVARGDDFLGFKTTQGKVVYLALEERRTDVKSHFEKMGADGSENVLVFADMAPPDAIKAAQKMAETEKPALIIVDTLSRLLRVKDLNDYAKVTLALEPLLALAHKMDTHICLLHHGKKGDGKGIDAILGSTALAGTVATVIQLDRSAKFRTIYSTQRVGQDLPETVLDFDSEHGWSSLAGSKEDCDIAQMKAGIIEVLESQSEPVTASVIHDESAGKRINKLRALRELIEEGKITRTGGGKRKQPYLYQLSGIQVLDITPEPENQNPKLYVTHQDLRTDSGTQYCEKEETQTQSLEPENDYDTLEREAIQGEGDHK